MVTQLQQSSSKKSVVNVVLGQLEKVAAEAQDEMRYVPWRGPTHASRLVDDCASLSHIGKLLLRFPGHKVASLDLDDRAAQVRQHEELLIRAALSDGWKYEPNEVKESFSRLMVVRFNPGLASPSVIRQIDLVAVIALPLLLKLRGGFDYSGESVDWLTAAETETRWLRGLAKASFDGGSTLFLFGVTFYVIDSVWSSKTGVPAELSRLRDLVFEMIVSAVRSAV